MFDKRKQRTASAYLSGVYNNDGTVHDGGRWGRRDHRPRVREKSKSRFDFKFRVGCWSYNFHSDPRKHINIKSIIRSTPRCGRAPLAVRGPGGQRPPSSFPSFSRSHCLFTNLRSRHSTSLRSTVTALSCRRHHEVTLFHLEQHRAAATI